MICGWGVLVSKSNGGYEESTVVSVGAYLESLDAGEKGVKFYFMGGGKVIRESDGRGRRWDDNVTRTVIWAELLR